MAPHSRPAPPPRAGTAVLDDQETAQFKETALEGLTFKSLDVVAVVVGDGSARHCRRCRSATHRPSLRQFPFSTTKKMINLSYLPACHLFGFVRATQASSRPFSTLAVSSFRGPQTLIFSLVYRNRWKKERGVSVDNSGVGVSSLCSRRHAKDGLPARDALSLPAPPKPPPTPSNIALSLLLFSFLLISPFGFPNSLPSPSPSLSCLRA